MRGNRTLKVTLIWVLLCNLTLVAAAAPFPPAAPANIVTLTPIPLEEPELVNPGRGWYRWRGEETVPLPEPAHDEYDRFFWHDPEHPEDSLETEPGVYNFDVIEQAVRAAAERGHKFAFRIRAMANKRSGQRYVPNYLADCGWDYRGTFIPDWNAACFQNNAAKLIRALGEKYNDDPRLAWVEIGLYGEWGEWALSAETFNSAPNAIDPPSEKALQRIIDMHIAAFPDVRKVMFAKTRSDAVIYALSRSDQIGWRVDCLGRDGYFNFSHHRDYLPAWKYMQDRWKTAPVIVEFCADNVSLSNSVPLRQVQDFHIALIGNGNFRDWDQLSPAAQENLTLLGKLAGYRYQIRHMTLPAMWVPGELVRLTTAWENVGVAPHYEPTEVRFQLYDPRRDATVWQANSTLDLQTLLPTGDQPVSLSDRLTLSAAVDPGVYQLRLIVVDPTGYRQPLKLAIAGRQADGSYLLGMVTVRAPTRRR